MLGWLSIPLLMVVGIAQGFIGYDCGNGNGYMATYSLLNVGECNIPFPVINVTKEDIQLLQMKEFTTVRIIQCKVEVNRIVYHCGMHSHVSVVANGQLEYLDTVSRDSCKQMHTAGMSRWGHRTVISGLKVNQTSTHSITLAGTLDTNGRCTAETYADPTGTWTNAVVQGTLKYTLMEYQAKVNLDANEVKLRSGTSCSLTEGHCLDYEGGHTYWEPSPVDDCKLTRYDVLYEGLSNKIIETNTDAAPVYSVESDGITFALTTKGIEEICGRTIIRTEHPKLMIFETKQKGTLIQRKPLIAENLDLFAYMNSKFIYVERHLRTQIREIYHDLLTHRCELERQVLENALSISTQAPDEFAYRLMRGPGYMAMIAGEAVHIIKCLPVEVKIRTTKECYEQLPVWHQNQTYFLSARTHVLVRTGTQITCNRLVPPMYAIGNKWFKLIPQLDEVQRPREMEPKAKLTWEYTNPISLAASGIYSDTELRKLRDHIMFPAERPAIINTIARGMAGESTDRQGISVSNLIDEDSIQKIIKSTWQSTWKGFLTFGTASAGVIGVILALRLVKLVVDTIVHGYALHEVYGWSIHLLASVWDSVTHLLLLLGTKKSRPTRDAEANDGLEEELRTTHIYSVPQHDPPNPTPVTLQSSRLELYPI
jgi:hypothetical protein